MLLVAAFLIVAVPICPVFFLGTLGALLLVSAPRTGREWLWIVLCVGVIVMWLQLPVSLSQLTVRASAATYIGAFVALTLAGVRSLFTRALLALALAGLAVTGWYAAFHLRFDDLQHDIVTQTWTVWRQFFTSLPATVPAAPADSMLQAPLDDRTRQLASTAITMGKLFPTFLALVALGGTWLSWTWYRRIARTPIGPAAGAFRDFRFNDHLVWLLVAVVGLTLIPMPDALAVATENVLLVVLSVYWLRGLAVVRTALRNASPLFLGIAAVIMLPMLAFAAVGFTLVGVADTWLDFRRRMAPPTGVPT